MENVTQRTCRHCDGPITEKNLGRGQWQRFCSPSCRKESRDQGRRVRAAQMEPCEVEGCEKLKRSAGSQWCEMHYGRNRRNGSPSTIKVRVPNGQCHHCGEPCTRRQRLFCSELCRRRNRLGVPGRLMACVVCDVQLHEDARPDAMYCTLECQRLQERGKRFDISGREMKALVDRHGCCAICGDAESELVVDHCHEQGHIRGLLCTQCNVGIGMLKDDPVRMANAITYLHDTSKPVSHNRYGTS